MKDDKEKRERIEKFILDIILLAMIIFILCNGFGVFNIEFI